MADDIPKSFTQSLIGDVTAAQARLTESNTEEGRRDLIRTTFAAIEGLNWQLRKGLLNTNKVTPALGHHEIAALSEETYAVNERGDVLPQPRFIPLSSSIRMVVKIVTRFRSTYTMDFGHVGWSRLKKSIEVRNRIVHPKSLGDLEVSEQEVTDALGGFAWFLAYVIEVMQEQHDHLQLRVDRRPPPA